MTYMLLCVERASPVNKMCVGDLKPLLQATLTTPDGCELVTLDDCKQATIVEGVFEDTPR